MFKTCLKNSLRQRELDDLEMQELMEEYQELHYYLAADQAQFEESTTADAPAPGVDDSMYDEEWLGFCFKAILKFCTCHPKRFVL